MLSHRLEALAGSIHPVPVLGSLEPWQASIFLTHLNQVRDYLKPSIPFASTIYDLAAARKYLQQYSDSLAHDGGRIYGLWLKDELIGGTMFRTFDAEARTCEVGVWIDPEYSGRGIVQAAVEAMIDWAVLSRRIERIEWVCDVENDRSRAIAQRLGMTREGVMRSLFELGGRRRDMELWVILGSEWLAARGLATNPRAAPGA